MVKFNGSVTILTQNVIESDGSARDATACARMTEGEKAEIVRMAEQERLSVTDFVRQGLLLRKLYRGDRFYKLVAHNKDIAELLDGLEMPLVVQKI